ncbi:MAG: InlB B-repeat-containing protein, partial [Clostridia bacterium]|nr:InlB B-repeat-containing protein [Clostridia bacterium]
YNNDPSQYYLGEFEADMSGVIKDVTVGGNLYTPNPQHGDVDVIYSIEGYADETAGVFVGGSMDFTITYKWVDTKDLWKLYKSETDTIKRFDYEELYSKADEKAWEDYETAYLNAAQVLCGGVDQEGINAAKVQLVDAIRNLKTLVEYDLNGGESQTEIEPTPVNIYSNVSVTEGVPSYTYSIIYSTELKSYEGITKSGYAARGWSLTSDNNIDSVFDNIMLPETASTEPLKVYMVWELGAYTIVYNSNTPSGANSIGVTQNQVCQYNESYTFSTCGYSIDNYTFMGWNTSPSGSGTMYEPRQHFENLTAPGSTLTLYAIWKENATNVMFNINLPGDVTGTTEGFDKTTLQELKVGSVIDLTKSPYRLKAEGYEHIGWSTQATATTPTFTDSFTVPGNTTTLFAVWQKKTAMVIYNLANGALVGDGYTEANSEIAFGDVIKLPTAENAIKPGYTLFGWRSGYDGQIYNNECVMPDQSGTIVFTAEWAPKTITITLHHNNDPIEDKVTTVSGLYETAIASDSFNTPERMEGYTFTGWYVLSDGVYTAYEIPKTFPGYDVELYAGWSMDKLSEQLNRMPSDIDENGIYKDGTVVPYYKEPGKSIAKEAYDVANGIYLPSEGVLYKYSDISKVNEATAALKAAVDALVPNPADYSVVDKYITYYYEMLPENQRPEELECADSHSYEYNGVIYQVSKNYFTTETFDVFKNAVDSVVQNKPMSAQSAVDKYAEELINAYEGLEPIGADYSEYEKYVNDAIILNGDLNEFYTEGTLGILWYEESSWYAFFEYVCIAESELLKGQNIFYQTTVDDYAALLEQVFNSMILNPPDFSEYDDNGYGIKALDKYNDQKVYTDTYRAAVYEAYILIEGAKTNGELSKRYDQEKVDAWISELAELLNKPAYRRYNITFYMNDTEGNIFSTDLLSCMAELNGYNPGIPSRDGYEFIGWYTTAEDTDDEIGQKIDFEITTLIMGAADRELYARWEKTEILYTLDVSAADSNIYVKLDKNSESSEGNRYINEEVRYGTKVVLRAVSNADNREFMYWKDNRNRIVSYDEVLEFTLEADRYLTAVYSEAEESGYYTVVFVDSILKTVISEQKVAKGKDATAPDISDVYGEYTFIKWNKSFDNVTGNIIVTSVYALSSEIFTITTVIGETTTKETYRYNTPVILTIADSDIPEGKVFAGWSLDNGKTIFSYDREYKFYAYKDITLTAVFSDNKAEAEASVSIETVITENNSESYKAEIMVSRYLPDNFVFVSSGVLLTKKAEFATEDALNFESQTENSNNILLFRTVENSNNGQYKLTALTSSDNTLYVRGFVVYLDTNTNQVITLYTDIIEEYC